MNDPYRKAFTIGATDCDALGHMNVATYFVLCNLTGFEMMERIGWPPGKANKGRRLSFAVVHADTDFLAEILEGEMVTVENWISSIGSKSAVWEYRIVKENGKPAYRSSWKSVLMDLDTRRATEVPEDLRSDLGVVMIPEE